jgi:hypothetical protein
MEDFKARMEGGESFRLDLNTRWEVEIVHPKVWKRADFQGAHWKKSDFFSFISGLPCVNENISFGDIGILERLLLKPSS